MTNYLKNLSITAALMLSAIALSGCGMFSSSSESANIMPNDFIKTDGSGAKIKALSVDEYNKLAAQHKAGDKSVLQSASSNDPYKLELQGDALVKSGDFESAIFKYQRALQMVPDNIKPRVKTKVGFSLLKEHRFSEAGKMFGSIKKTKKLASQIYLGLGLAKMSLGDMENAEKALKQAVESPGASWKAYNAMGIIYNKFGEADKALNMFNEAIARRPDVAALFNNRGLSQMMIGRLIAAEMNFIKALKLDPNHALARNNLGLLYSSQGRWREARQTFAEAIGEAKAHNNLGVLLAYGGQYLKAKEHFRRAVENSPTYYGLADRHLSRIKSMGLVKPASFGVKSNNTLDPTPLIKSDAQLDSLPVNQQEAETAKLAKKLIEPKFASVSKKISLSKEKTLPKKVLNSVKIVKAKKVGNSGYRYFVQLATLKNFGNAQAAMNRWMKKGYSCQIDVWISEKQVRWYRLLVGPFTAKEDMQSVLDKMTASQGVTDYVVVKRKIG